MADSDEKTMSTGDIREAVHRIAQRARDLLTPVRDAAEDELRDFSAAVTAELKRIGDALAAKAPAAPAKTAGAKTTPAARKDT